jgi:hypothetical protein
VDESRKNTALIASLGAAAFGVMSFQLCPSSAVQKRWFRVAAQPIPGLRSFMDSSVPAEYPKAPTLDCCCAEAAMHRKVVIKSEGMKSKYFIRIGNLLDQKSTKPERADYS